MCNLGSLFVHASNDAYFRFIKVRFADRICGAQMPDEAD